MLTPLTIVRSGNIASGVIASGHLASGFVPALIGSIAAASGVIGSGGIQSGSVQGFFGTIRNIASGTVGVMDFGSGAVISGAIASGQIGPFHLSDASIIASHVASGAIASGNIASGSVGRFHIGSGQLAGFELGSGAIVSGRIASGQVGFGHLANASVQSGSIASGNVSLHHVASGILRAGISFIMDGGGSVLTAGTKGYVEIPFSGRIDSVTLLPDQSGQIFVGIFKAGYAATLPNSGNTITTSGVPITSGPWVNQYSGAAVLSGWSLACGRGDIMGFSVISVSNVQRVTVALGMGYGA